MTSRGGLLSRRSLLQQQQQQQLRRATARVVLAPQIRRLLSAEDRSREEAGDSVLRFLGGEDEICVSNVPVRRGGRVEKESNRFGALSAFPKADPELLEGANLVMGISVLPYSVGWARIDMREMRLADFSATRLVLKDPKREVTSPTVLETVRRVRARMPEADLYVVEEVRRSGRHKATSLQTELMSMLAALLTSGVASRGVAFQSSAVVDAMFELNVNNERVSSGQKLQRILETLPGARGGEVRFPVGERHVTLGEEFLRRVNESAPVFRDAYATPLLILSSFIRVNYADGDE